MFLHKKCATIISGSRQNVEITSEPSSAKVYINEIEIGQTPVQKNLKRIRSSGYFKTASDIFQIKKSPKIWNSFPVIIRK